MNSEQVLNELKERRLPTFGTGGERRERLKKSFGIDTPQDAHAGGSNYHQQNIQSQHLQHSNTQKRSNCRDEIEKLKQ